MLFQEGKKTGHLHVGTWCQKNIIKQKCVVFWLFLYTNIPCTFPMWLRQHQGFVFIEILLIYFGSFWAFLPSLWFHLHLLDTSHHFSETSFKLWSRVIQPALLLPLFKTLDRVLCSRLAVHLLLPLLNSSQVVTANRVNTWILDYDGLSWLWRRQGWHHLCQQQCTPCCSSFSYGRST